MIINADASHVPLADNSVQCVVTSPPYWGLRDYGTATWQGGDEGCDHLAPALGGAGESSLLNGPVNGPAKAIIRLQQYRDICRKCGATRIDKQLGLEPTPEEYVTNMVAVFREVWRVLRDDGTCWVNMGDSYAGGGGFSPNAPSNLAGAKQTTVRGANGAHGLPVTPGLKPKDLIGIPWRLAFALQADGWWLRSDIIWSKPNPMPESVTDRPTKAHEYIFLLSKSASYYYDAEAIKENGSENPVTKARNCRADLGLVGRRDLYGTREGQSGNGGYERKAETTRNRRTVWTIATQPYPDAHFATFPEDIVKPAILAGTSHRGACAECGAPWERVTERESITPCDYEGKYLSTDPQSNGRRLLANTRARREAGNEHDNPFPAAKTLGWRPSCACGTQETKSCIVLDPFVGSGTTVKVAQDLGRIGIGLDLNPAYLQMGKRRAAQLGMML